MKSRDALFCSLLKAGLWNETRDIHLSKDEFALLWKDAVRQVCRGLVSHPLVLSGSLPSQIVSRLQDHLLAIAGLGLKMDRVIEKSVLELQSNGIDPVLLKGRGVGSYYPNPMIRENGDVDLYVGPDNYKAAFEVLVKLADKPEDTLFEGGSKHSHLEIDGVIVEIHKYCEILPRRYDARFQSIARKGLTEGLVIMPFIHHIFCGNSGENRSTKRIITALPAHFDLGVDDILKIVLSCDRPAGRNKEHFFNPVHDKRPDDGVHVFLVLIGGEVINRIGFSL